MFIKHIHSVQQKHNSVENILITGQMSFYSSIGIDTEVTVVVLSFILSVHCATESSFASVKNMNRLSTLMACNLTGGFAKMLSFSSYGWLTYRTSVRNIREKMHNFPHQNSRKLCDISQQNCSLPMLLRPPERRCMSSLASGNFTLHNNSGEKVRVISRVKCNIASQYYRQ